MTIRTNASQRIAEVGRLLRTDVFPGSIAGVVWIACTAGLFALVRAYGTDLPFADDFPGIVTFATGDRGLTFEELWKPHNTHRPVVPTLLFVTSYRVTGRLVLPVLYLTSALLSFAAWWLVRALNRMRGSANWRDALIPIALLNWGHYETVLWAGGLAHTLVVASICVFVGRIATATVPLRWPETLGLTLLAATLPLCHAIGIAFAPLLSLWLVRSAGASRGSRTAAALGTVAVVAVSLLALAPSSPDEIPSDSLLQKLLVRTWKVLSNMWGPIALELSTFLPWATAYVIVATTAMLCIRRKRRPEDRLRTEGQLLLTAAFVALAFGVASNRNSMYAPRYVTLFAPLTCLVYVAWATLGDRRGADGVGAALCVLVLGFGAWSSQVATVDLRNRLLSAAAFETDLRAGVPVAELARRSAASMFPLDEFSECKQLEGSLRSLHRAGIGVFKNLNVDGERRAAEYEPHPLRPPAEDDDAPNRDPL